MDKDAQFKTLKNPKASKEQLRAALSAALGVPYIVKDKGAETLFTQCRKVFMAAYERHTGVSYVFGAKDAKALKELIAKVGSLANAPTDDTTIEMLGYLIDRLPEWYKQNAFSLPIVNNKFNEIVASIKKNGGQSGITNDYKARVISDLLS